MSFHPPFPPAAVEYIRQHQDEWPSILAFKIGRHFNYSCTERGVRQKLKEVRHEAKEAKTL